MAAIPLPIKQMGPRLAAGLFTGMVGYFVFSGALLPYRSRFGTEVVLFLFFLLIGCGLWLEKTRRSYYVFASVALVLGLSNIIGIEVNAWYSLVNWTAALLTAGVLWGKEVQAQQGRKVAPPLEVGLTLLSPLVWPGLRLFEWAEAQAAQGAEWLKQERAQAAQMAEQRKQERAQAGVEASTRTPTQPQAERAPVVVQPVPARVLAAPLAGYNLYAMTLLVEGLCALVRSFLLYLPLLAALAPLHILVFWATHENYYTQQFGVWGYDNGQWLGEGIKLALTYTLVITLVVGFWPVLRSLWHSLVPYGRSGDGPQESETLGAREPTRAEHATIIETLKQIQAQAGDEVAAPSAWLVLDEPLADAFTLGSTTYLSRAAVESEHLAGIIAHELGHIAHKDGDLLLSMRRFITPLAYFIGIDRSPLPAGAVLATGAYQKIVRSEDEQIFYRFQALKIKGLLAFWFGGLGLILLGQSWAAFWRQRDYLADDYAVRLGQDEALKAVLQMHRSLDVVQPFLLTNRPYTAERLDRLEG